MLYATTRGKHDVVTAYRATHNDCYSDGGLFVPFRMPQLSESKILSLASATQGQIVADILNEFLGCSLTPWEVEYALGRTPAQTVGIGRRLVIAQMWNFAGWEISWAVRRLFDCIRGKDAYSAPSNWMEIVVRIALLFSTYGTLLSRGEIRSGERLDVAVATGDFAMPMAVWYARQMGLPIGNIICGCNANGGFWDLLNRGEFSTGEVVTRTLTPEADIVVPRNLERLICATLGVDETLRYLQCCRKGRNYMLSPELLNRLSQGMFAAVISDSRVSSIVPGVYKTSGHILSPYGALAYGSLLDYRSVTGYTSTALLIEERSPMRDAQLVSKMIKINENELQELINK